MYMYITKNMNSIFRHLVGACRLLWGASAAITRPLAHDELALLIEHVLWKDRGGCTVRAMVKLV